MNEDLNLLSTSQLISWCAEGQTRVMDMFDTIMDKTEADNPEAKELMLKAIAVLNELEQLEDDLTNEL